MIIFIITCIGYAFRDDLMKVNRWKEKDELRINRFRIQYGDERLSSQPVARQSCKVDLRDLQNEFK